MVMLIFGQNFSKMRDTKKGRFRSLLRIYLKLSSCPFGYAPYDFELQTQL